MSSDVRSSNSPIQERGSQLECSPEKQPQPVNPSRRETMKHDEAPAIMAADGKRVSFTASSVDANGQGVEPVEA